MYCRNLLSLMLLPFLIKLLNIEINSNAQVIKMHVVFAEYMHQSALKEIYVTGSPCEICLSVNLSLLICTSYTQGTSLQCMERYGFLFLICKLTSFKIYRMLEDVLFFLEESTKILVIAVAEPPFP